MNRQLDNSFAFATLSEWLPLSKQTILVAFAVAVMVDAVVFVIPRGHMVWELSREAAELEERQRNARVLAEAMKGSATQDARRAKAPGQIDPRDLLPTVSMLARQARMEIVAIKQSALDKDGAGRRIHLRAHAAFAQVVTFVDRVSAAIPLARAEDMTLRHVPATLQQHAEIELEYVVSVVSVNGQKPLPAEDSQNQEK